MGQIILTSPPGFRGGKADKAGQPINGKNKDSGPCTSPVQQKHYEPIDTHKHHHLRRLLTKQLHRGKRGDPQPHVHQVRNRESSVVARRPKSPAAPSRVRTPTSPFALPLPISLDPRTSKHDTGRAHGTE